MNKPKLSILTLALGMMSVLAFSACKDNPGAMDDPAPTVSTIALPDNAVNGETITGIPTGTYDLVFNVKGDQDNYMMTVGDHSCITTEMNADTWTSAMMPNITVTDGTIKLVGEPLSTTGTPTFSGIRLVQNNSGFQMIKGGDVSELTKEEDNNATYSSEGTADDCLSILKNNGMNMVRLRLFVNPGEEYVDTTDAKNPVSYRVPEGYQDEDDILSLAKRAKEQGMDIELTFNYSDYWADVTVQQVPKAWIAEAKTEGLVWDDESGKEVADTAKMTDFLVGKVSEYTKDILQKMVAQGTAPAYVSIGNETMNGMLYPYGAGTDAYNMSRMFKAGCDAVHAVCPEAKAMVHLNADYTKYTWFLGIMKQYAVNYDVIAMSYYPYWTAYSAESACDFAESIYSSFGKKVLFLETGFAWTNEAPAGNSFSNAQIKYNTPYKDMTQEAQRQFLFELTQEIYQAKDHCILGYCYWDPIYIDNKNCGWAQKKQEDGTWKDEPNVTFNSTLFDFSGKALPAFDAIKYNK